MRPQRGNERGHNELDARAESLARETADRLERLKHDGRKRGVAVRPRCAEDVLEETAGVHLRAGREVEDLEDGVSAKKGRVNGSKEG